MAELIPVRVRGLIMDDTNKSPIVILQEENGERALPIWIGEAEARAIDTALAKEEMERPMTHDLMARMLKSLKARVMAINITSLKNNTFFAEIHIQAGGEQILVDARPSDSIALSLRTGAQIMVSEEVLNSGLSAQEVSEPHTTEKEKRERLKKFLEDLDPKDFGKFGV